MKMKNILITALIVVGVLAVAARVPQIRSLVNGG